MAASGGRERRDQLALTNNRRLFGPLGNIPPSEFEPLYDGTRQSQAAGVGLN